MSWAVGEFGGRDIGYGVPALCDYPNCSAEIDRGLSYVCGGEPYGGDKGCGLFFCEKHRGFNDDDDDCKQYCERCLNNQEPFEETPDVAEWIEHKLTDESWQEWRDENTEEVEKMKAQLNK